MIASLSPEAGGPTYSVPRLAEVSRDEKFVTSLFTLEASDGIHRNDVRQHARSSFPLLKSLGWSQPLHRALAGSASTGAIIHTHGLWLMPNIIPSWIRRQSEHSRLVHSPRGMLAPAARRISALKKAPVWWLWQRQALAAADLIHATAESEYEEIRTAGFTNPIAVIPNGIDLPDLNALPGKDRKCVRTVLSLGRIHPKKGLDRLLRAWATIEVELPNWRLLIVGPNEVGHAEELRQLALSLGVKKFEISGPAYGVEKWKIMRSADLFVLPTLNENFGISVAEALSAEIPVICTQGAPWPGLNQQRCGWWIEHGVDALIASLRRATAYPPSELAEMGRRGRVWMERDFGWEAIGAEMLRAYRWLRTGGQPPTCIKLS